MINAEQFKDWVTGAAILVGGGWGLWKFRHADWLRQRTETPSLEGSNPPADIVPLSQSTVLASLRWTWRNAGILPVYIADDRCFVEVFLIPDSAAGFIDPRLNRDEMENQLVGKHNPLDGYGFYTLEQGTSSSILSVTVLPRGRTFLARMRLTADRKRHPTGGDWNFSWERWQVFTTPYAEALE